MRVSKIHFIGIGGVGMSGIAKVAKDQGYDVSGSDLKSSRYTKQLEDAGIAVSIGHAAANIPEGSADEVTVVVSTAILDNNPELSEAHRRGLPIIHRADMLARLGKDLKTLAVAGTHGKTTTSSMLATVLDGIGEDPTFLIGGIVHKYGTNARSGSGPLYVIEADESDKSFMRFTPAAAIVTNIEPDHLDHYSGVDEIYALFARFIASVPDGSPVVVCADDERLLALAHDNAANVIGYGFGESADVRIVEHHCEGIASHFELRFPDGGTVRSSIKQNPGMHNILNGAAVLALLDALGFDRERTAQELASFAGVRRRFDLVGEKCGVTVVDDYAHHPTEIAATIEAAKALDFNKVHVVFQPHRYSRASLFTDVLHDEFARAFDAADTVTFMDVFSAGETPVPGVNGRTFLNVVLSHEEHPPIKYVARHFEVPSAVADIARAHDLVITMGAGDVTELGKHILDAVEARAGSASEPSTSGDACLSGGASGERA